MLGYPHYLRIHNGSQQPIEKASGWNELDPNDPQSEDDFQSELIVFTMRLYYAATMSRIFGSRYVTVEPMLAR